MGEMNEGWARLPPSHMSRAHQEVSSRAHQEVRPPEVRPPITKFALPVASRQNRRKMVGGDKERRLRRRTCRGSMNAGWARLRPSRTFRGSPGGSPSHHQEVPFTAHQEVGFVQGSPGGSPSRGSPVLGRLKPRRCQRSPLSLHFYRAFTNIPPRAARAANPYELPIELF
jgi:hypothetical protein